MFATKSSVEQAEENELAVLACNLPIGPYGGGIMGHPYEVVTLSLFKTSGIVT
jgi:hypothetical protein